MAVRAVRHAAESHLQDMAYLGARDEMKRPSEILRALEDVGASP